MTQKRLTGSGFTDKPGTPDLGNAQPMEAARTMPASFDKTKLPPGWTLAELKKLQDPDKFTKARFSFRLYKRP